MGKIFSGSIFLIMWGLSGAFGYGQGAATVPNFSSGGFVSSVVMTGNVTWHYGSDEQAGTATLQANANGQSRVELQLTRGTRIETQNPFADAERACTWTSYDGVLHPVAWHNCWLGTIWFLPQITLQPGAGSPDAIATQITASDGTNLLHCERHPTGVKNQKSAELLARISASDLQIDPRTGQPLVLFFNSHPDNDAATNIATEVHFSDYRNVQGVSIPFHIQKFVNHSLILDFRIATVTLQ
jgi:hypothetical protein